MAGDSTSGGGAREEGLTVHLLERAAWLIRLRWAAIVGVAAAVFLSARAEWVPDARPLALIALAMVAYNAVFQRLNRRGPSRVESDAVEARLFVQLLCDLASLSLLLHWSGGIENPFAMFFAFHMAIAAILLERWNAFLLAGLAMLLFGGTVVTEHLGLVPHHTLILAVPSAGSPGIVHGPPESTVYLIGYLIAFGSMLFGTVYFVQSVETRRRRIQALAAQRERIAQSRERMARIGEISSGVAHTIRNPLHGLMNCVKILQRKAAALGDAEVDEILDMMNEGLRRISSVTQRLLSFSRTTELRVQPRLPGPLAEEALEFLRTAASERGIALEVRDEGAPEVPLDPDRFGEALISLVDNALYACEAGDRVSVVLRRDDASGGALVLVEDTGSGIEPERIPRLFDPFYTTKAIGEGSGLGLAITRRIVEAHGGTIDVESRLGEGSVFRMRFPMRRPEALEGRTLDD